jgi:hypothetical protein
MRESFIEYHDRHLPGNPGLPLDHWTKGEPLSQAAAEKIDTAKQSNSKPALNVKAMTDEQLLPRFNSPDTDSFDLQLVALELKRRGHNLEDLHRERARGRFG